MHYNLLSFVENVVFCRHLKWDYIFSSTLMNYTQKLPTHVEGKVKALLLKQFVVVFDGWKIGVTLYVAILLHFRVAAS